MLTRAVSTLVLLSLTFASTDASATSDFGDEYTVLRFAANSRHALLSDCCVQCTRACSLIVVDGGGTVKESVSLDGIGPSSDQDDNFCFVQSEPLQWYFDSVKADPTVKKLRAKYQFSALPKVQELSPDATRFAFVGASKGRGVVSLVEGGNAKRIGASWKDQSDGELVSSIKVSWSPDGRMAVAAGNYLSTDDAPDFHWTAYVTAAYFAKPSESKLNKRKVAVELNSQGYYYYKEASGKNYFYHDPTPWYAKAVKWDPTYEYAIYNLACMYAVNKKRGRAFRYLAQLRQLGTKLARKLLDNASTDRDFARYYKNPRFIELTR